MSQSSSSSSVELCRCTNPTVQCWAKNYKSFLKLTKPTQRRASFRFIERGLYLSVQSSTCWSLDRRKKNYMRCIQMRTRCDERFASLRSVIKVSTDFNIAWRNSLTALREIDANFRCLINWIKPILGRQRYLRALSAFATLFTRYCW